MTPDGEGMLVDLENLSKVRTVQLSSFSFEKFRQMCMLSGCDYIPSIKGMGLMKAHKALRRHSSAYQVSFYAMFIKICDEIVIVSCY